MGARPFFPPPLTFPHLSWPLLCHLPSFPLGPPTSPPLPTWPLFPRSPYLATLLTPWPPSAAGTPATASLPSQAPPAALKGMSEHPMRWGLDSAGGHTGTGGDGGDSTHGDTEGSSSPRQRAGTSVRRPGRGGEAEVACGGSAPPGPCGSAPLFLSPSLFFLPLCLGVPLALCVSSSSAWETVI